MTKRIYSIYIKDIIKSISKIEEFTKGLSFEDFCADDKTSSAVLRKLEIIGEATKNVPITIKNKYSKIDWRGMAGMRDKLIHDYFGVDFEIVWKVIKEDLKKVKPLIKMLYKDIKE